MKFKIFKLAQERVYNKESYHLRDVGYNFDTHTPLGYKEQYFQCNYENEEYDYQDAWIVENFENSSYTYYYYTL